MKKFVITLASVKIMALAIATFLFIVSCQAISSQPTDLEAVPTPTPAAEVINKIDRPTSDPYTGDLSIFEDAQRDKNLQIERVMDILGIGDKKSVADIGAGSGWFTVRAAKRVGVNGQVFAVDINQDYLDHIAERAKAEGFANIKTILGQADDPLLPANSVDVVLILKTYHEIAEPIGLMKNLKKALKKGAIVGIIDRNGNGDDHGLNKDTVIAELKRSGFDLKEQYDFVKPDKMDYFLVFTVRP